MSDKTTKFIVAFLIGMIISWMGQLVMYLILHQRNNAAPINERSELTTPPAIKGDGGNGNYRVGHFGYCADYSTC